MSFKTKYYSCCHFTDELTETDFSDLPNWWCQNLNLNALASETVLHFI